MGGRAHLLARRPPRRKGTGTSGRPEREPPSQPVGALSVCVCGGGVPVLVPAQSADWLPQRLVLVWEC